MVRVQPAALWGVVGVILLLANGVHRVLPHALEPLHSAQFLPWWQLALYLGSIAFNAYMEGYRGFHLRVAPRVVQRAHELSERDNVYDTVLAPLYCASFYGAPVRTLVVRYLLLTLIVGVIVGMHYVPQPWRGIVDAGVVVGLGMGAASIAWTYYRSLMDPEWFEEVVEKTDAKGR
jgi:hypothetical protein